MNREPLARRLALRGFLAPRMVDQNTPNGLGRGHPENAEGGVAAGDTPEHDHEAESEQDQAAGEDGASVFATADGWSETGLTWAGRPAAAGPELADVGVTAPGWAPVDVSEWTTVTAS